MATTAAMAALRAMALGNCGVGSRDEDDCNNSGGKDYGNGGNGVGDDCHRPPCQPQHCCQHHLLCCRRCSHLSVCNNEGDGKGFKSNGDCDKEGNGDGGKSDGNSDKEGDDEAGKGNGNGN
jgi:hypothetical protein